VYTHVSVPKAAVIFTLPRAITVESQQTPVARQWLSNRHVTAAMDTYATMEDRINSICYVTAQLPRNQI
jgi:hypothetical protein